MNANERELLQPNRTLLVPSALHWRSFAVKSIAQQHILIAQIQPPARNDRVRPGLLAAAVGLLEAAMFPVAGRAGLDEGDRPRIFLAQVEMAVCTDERTFAKLVPLLPARHAGAKVLAGPAFAIGIAIDKIAHADPPAVVVAHD